MTYTVTFTARGWPTNVYTVTADSKESAIQRATTRVRFEEPKIAYRLSKVEKR
jgi:hypothetical protein